MSNTHRASLLNGLRTGGVRSVSANIPHTAAPGATTFNVNHFAPQPHPTNIFPEEEEDQLAEMPQHLFNYRNLPMTAAVDGNNHFSQQQAQYPNLPFNPSISHPSMVSPAIQNQAMSMQMLQLEMMRIQAQAIQNQQYQAELIAQAQRQQQQFHNHARRAQHNYQPPASAGPTNFTFDQRATSLGAQPRRPNQAEQLRAQLGLGPAPASSDDQVPMTAALGGRFGSRSASLNVPNPAVARFTNDEYENAAPPPTPSSTTIISGGTSLGNLTSNNIHLPSKSDSVSSWRRGGSNSVLAGHRAVSSPIVKVTAPDSERISPPSFNAAANARSRPQPLRFNPTISQPLPAVTVIDTDEDGDADSSSSSGKTHSSPTTPRSSTSSNEIPLSPREEASKKLYEGLGIGRPSSASPEQYPTVSATSHRMVSQPTRQPRGPPSGADELGPRNFATRIRRKAIGGLLDARGRREAVEVF